MERLCYDSHIQPRRASLLREGLLFLRAWALPANSEHPLVSQNGSEFSLSAWAGLGAGDREKQPGSWF